MIQINFELKKRTSACGKKVQNSIFRIQISSVHVRISKNYAVTIGIKGFPPLQNVFLVHVPTTNGYKVMSDSNISVGFV